MVKEKFTRIEIRIIEFVADGLSNEQIANKLFVKRKTVISHLNDIYSKLNTYIDGRNKRIRTVLYYYENMKGKYE